jgi:DNA-binding transcriptional LysR family regulator
MVMSLAEDFATSRAREIVSSQVACSRQGHRLVARIRTTSSSSGSISGGICGRGWRKSSKSAADILAKRLIRILPDWHSEEVTIHLVFATKRGIVPAVRVLIDYLAEHFKFQHGEGFKKKKKTTFRSKDQSGVINAK